MDIKVHIAVDLSNHITRSYESEYCGACITSDRHAYALGHQLMLSAKYNSNVFRSLFSLCGYDELLPSIIDVVDLTDVTPFVETSDALSMNLSLINYISVIISDTVFVMDMLNEIVRIITNTTKRVRIYYKFPYNMEQYVVNASSVRNIIRLIKITLKYVTKIINRDTLTFIVMKRNDIDNINMKKIINAIGYDVEDVLNKFVDKLNDIHLRSIPSSVTNGDNINKFDVLLYMISNTINLATMIDKYRNRYVELMLMDTENTTNASSIF